MKQEPASICRESSNAKLSQHEALQGSRLHEQPERGGTLDTLLAAPVWEPVALRAHAGDGTAYAQHRILICGLPQVAAAQLEAQVSGSRCAVLQAAPSATAADGYAAVALACFETIQGLLRDKAAGRCLVQVVAADDDAQMPAGLSGLMETAALENPAVVGQVVLVGRDTTTADLAQRLRAERSQLNDCADRVDRIVRVDRVVRYCGNDRLARRWQFVDGTPSPSGDLLAFKEHGVYLVTGGLGGLGVLVAREILARTAGARIVLAGRAAAAGPRLAVLDALRRTGRVQYRQADVADAAQVEGLIASIAGDHGQLNGIIHGAAILRDDFILRKHREQFGEVLRPKVAGTGNLDLASRAMALDFFVLFSSIASWAGNVGQADYAAANGFMEQFAGYRNRLVAAGSRAGRTLAIAWPHWLDGGMNIDATSMAQLQKRTGLRSMGTADGMAALHRGLALAQSHVMVMHGNGAGMRRALESAGTVVQAGAAPSAFPASSATATRGNVPIPSMPATLSRPAQGAGPALPDELAAKTRDFLRREFSVVLKIPLDRMEARTALENYGIDSILAMNLTNQLESTFGTLPKTLFFEYQNIEELAGYLVRSHVERLQSLFATTAMTAITAGTAPAPVPPRRAPDQSAPGLPSQAASLPLSTLQGRAAGRRGRRRFLPSTDAAQFATPVAGTPAGEPGASRPRANLAPAGEPIAIVGLSGRYPESRDVEAFWRNLRDGRDCIVEIPGERWDWRDHYSEDRTREGAHISKWGGFIEGVDEFDPRFFNIAPREAASIDPQERLFLQHAWMAVEDAGYTRASLQVPGDAGLAGQVGVYAGVMYGEYNLSGSLASIANRVSYFLNLHGPSLTLDTMCSSSLTAIHLACQDLRLGRTSLALAGGVNVSIHPNKYTMLSGGQFLSSDGHCQSFGEGGNGYIPGEGVGVAVLKRLADAERDGNHIYGVIRGSALNHGGKTNGYTVPNPQAQAEVIRRALAEAGVDPRHVSYVEAHGTGTRLGDPIEIAALTRAFNEAAQSPSQEPGFCLIGSAKSNIGHCESAAGIAGVTKVLLQMKHGAIVASLHSGRLNPHIDFGATPFVVVQSLRAWQPPVVDGQALPRIAGISSFGAGGSNAHVIVEEYRAPEAAASAAGQVIATCASGQVVVPLSARTTEQLEERVRDLLAFIDRSERPLDLQAMAWTLQVGREAMEARAAFLAASIDDLAAKLRSFPGGDDAGGEIHRGQVRQHRDTVALLTDDPDFRNAIERWVAERRLSKLAEFWAKGLDVAWDRLAPAGGAPRMMSLPTYPFARERYWTAPSGAPAPAPAPAASASGAAAAAAAAMASLAAPPQAKILHPLVHANDSNLRQQRYVTTFSGSEPFLDAGPVPGQVTLPPLLALEMTLAAVALAVPGLPKPGTWELQGTEWGAPCTVAGGRGVAIALFARGDEAVDVEIHSGEGADAMVHCQSHAVSSPLAVPACIDLAGLRAAMASQADASVARDATNGSDAALSMVHVGHGQALAQLRLLPAPGQAASLLHPGLPQRIGQLLELIHGEPASPLSLERLRILRAVPEQAAVWLRRTGRGAIDIDICDEQGNPCIQMTGLCCDAVVSESIAEPVAASAGSEAAIESPPANGCETAAPREIVLETVATQAPAGAREASVIGHPPRVRLLDLGGVPAGAVVAKATVRLAPLPAASATSAASAISPATAQTSPVRLFDLGEGIFSIEMHGPLQAAVAPLLQALRSACDEASLKVLLLRGHHPLAWRSDRDGCNLAIERGLFAAVTAFPCPLVAVVDGGASGAGLLLASACDFMLCDEDGQYAFTDAAAQLFPGSGEDRFFRERLGDALADDLLYRSTRCSGRQLRDKGWACRVSPSSQLDADARRLATGLANKSRLALQLLKTHLGRHLAPLAQALTAVDPVQSAVRADGKAVDSVLAVRLGGHDEADLRTLIRELRAAIDRVAQAPQYKAIVVSSAVAGFLEEAGDARTTKALLDVVRGSPVPVIAALESGAQGAAWLFGLSCDGVVYNRSGRHVACAPWSSPALARDAVALCTLRLGASFGREVSLAEGGYSGAELRSRVGTVVVADGDQVLAQALRLAASWDAWPRATVAAWRQAQTARLRNLVDALPEELPEVPPEVHDGREAPCRSVTLSAPRTVALTSSVVTVTAYADGVVVVALEDREAKNMFSEALVAGLREAFAHIDTTPGYKAVVLTGYDSFFATGGTRQTLLAIQEGQARFTDEKVFQRPMDCVLPVIAAIQGHGIGGGWSFGMFADLIVLGAESRFLSPYMGYGFTPGAGSTLVFPARIGHDLARETLLTAQEISGHELAARGVALPVLPRRDVLPGAIALAARIARLTREQLVAMKRLWTHTLRESCDDTCSRELAMHELTFVGNAETLATIQATFSGSAPTPAAAVEPATQPVTQPASHPVTQPASHPVTQPAAPATQTAAPVIGKLKAMLAQELFLEPGEIDEDTQFIDLGLDSITGVTWIRKINAHFGTDIEATRVYSHPTLKQLSGLVAGEAASGKAAGPAAATPLPTALPPQAAPAAVAAPARAAAPSEAAAPVAAAFATARAPVRFAASGAERLPSALARRQLAPWRREERAAARAEPQVQSTRLQPLAVIGMAGQFPKAKDVGEFWRNLAQGRNCVEEVPDARWNPRAYYREGSPVAGKTNSKWLGALDAYDQFDPLFFNISPTEAECMDPQQRLFLQACWHTVENAGYGAQALSGSQCGVFVGCGPSDYLQASPEQQLSAQGFTGAATSILAARVSYFLNLRGPCLSIDTACSSSLVAIASACDSLNAGDSDLALAGGVYVMGGPAMHIMTAQAGMLSTDGRCFSFDQRANGFVPGEGVGVMLLKRLADAERDQDRILAVIEGWGVNQDGKTNGITAPNEESQTRLLQSVYRKFAVDPAGIQLVEAHGTGTKLGDPIEVAGLKAAFKAFTDKSAYCALGSVKSNIGHCLTAAGAAGFIKLVLALKHRVLPPTINYERANEHIALDGSPFFVNASLRDWTVANGERRRAAISSFGFSGTNAHLVVAEHQPAARTRPAVAVAEQDGRIIVPLSARTAQQLRQKAQDLLDHIRSHPALDLQELAYTLQAGRDPMGERLGFLVGSLPALGDRLQRWLGGESAAPDVHQGQVKRDREAIRLIVEDDDMRATIVDKWLGRRKLSSLLDLWVKGLDLDWNRLYGDTKPQRIELPAYPFAVDRFWIGGGTAPGDRRTARDDEAAGDAAAPLPQTTMATLRWDPVKVFDDSEPAAGQRILVIGADDEEGPVVAAGLQRRDPQATLAFASIGPGDTVADIGAKLAGADFDRIVWIARASQVATLTEESIIRDQDRGVLQVLRMTRALTELGYEKRALDWDLLTIGCLAANQADSANPTHAGLQGFSGSMAEVFPRWRIRLLDLQELSQDAVAGMHRLPKKVKGACYALRSGRWHGQTLVPVRELGAGRPPYRSGGVYVVIGGSGGIGEIWTRHVIERHQADVVWIGRRELNDEIRTKLDRLAVHGKRPEYIRADASDRQELEAAYERIKARYPTIHGIVHSAVGAFDQSLRTVPEDDFRSILSVKIDLSVRIAQVFNREKLDFVLFFSSNASFVRGAGMSGYSAGCAFKDAYALQLGKLWDCDVKVVNWGYWSVGAGDAMTDAMKAYFHEMGYSPLDPQEAMRTLDGFLASGFRQLSIGRSVQPAAGHVDLADEWMAGLGDGPGGARSGARSGLDLLEMAGTDPASKFPVAATKAGAEMEDRLCALLRGILDSVPDTLPGYRRWLAESRAIVARSRRSDEPATVPTLRQLWRQWDEAMHGWEQDSGRKALCLLVDRCLRALADILTGKQKATDVIFPGSSLALIESVYKTDTLSLAYNESLRDTLIAAVAAQLREQPEADIRLLEIGAGTGATTVGILEKLQPYRSRIAEYCYTDLSKAFLFHAQAVYAPGAPYLCTKLFNVEQPIAAQGIEAGRYDVVIAANVMHATRNIRNALRNAKAVLRRGGMLLLNEISDKSVCGHLTFGLLDGWWLNEDDDIRIPGSPGLYPQAWQRVLEEEGFHSVRFPCSDMHGAGQQIVMAFSDGVIRQRVPAVPAVLVDGGKGDAPKRPADAPRRPADAPRRPAPVDDAVQCGGDESLREKTIRFCKQVIGTALKISSDQIDGAEPLESYGIDSIIIGLVNQQLQKHFGDVGATLLYEFQTVDALAGHLVETQRADLERLFAVDRPVPETPPNAAAARAADAADATDATRRVARMPLRTRAAHGSQPRLPDGAAPSGAHRHRPIAIIGLSGLYAHACDLQAFWENLKSGRNCITEIPESRWPLEGFYEPDEQKAVEAGRSYCKWGSFVEQFAEFDTLFFGIPPREALNMDPQERLFMQAAWSALENAGYTRSALKRRFDGRVGVFAGITRAGYNLYRQAAGVDDKFWPRTSFSSVANRLSYFLDINGPSLPVDTMCSSSLTAIHEACEHIRSGDCDLAFAGGVNLYLHPTSYVDMSSQHMLSRDGLCRSFGEGANGFVPGEGVGVVLLKSLDRAVQDRDIVHGVILATSVNHGGKTNGFTVPNPVAQAELVRQAIDKAGISARDISYIEAHGTGTELGDPIEIAGLQQAFRKDTQDKGYCRIGSAKSNLGHLEAAAGIAGLSKVLLQLKHRQIVPSLHASTVNPHIRFEKTPFEVNQALVPWEAPLVEGNLKPLIAGISSFGAGGANAHVIVQESPSRVDETDAVAHCKGRPVAVVLSARTPEQLQQKASDLLDFVGMSAEDVDLGAIAYTLQIGREAMEVRLGLMVSSVAQLTMALGAVVYGEEEIDGVFRGQVQRKADGRGIGSRGGEPGEAIDKWLAEEDYAKLLALWVRGLDVDWDRLYGKAKPRRVELPTYPFAKDSYWLDSVTAGPRAGGAGRSGTAGAAGRTGVAPASMHSVAPASTDSAATPLTSMMTIEDVLMGIDDASLEAGRGVELLKRLL